MASKEFVAVSWSPGQLVEEDTLDQMNNNITYLRDQMVDGQYQHRLGGLTDTNIKLLCGYATIPPNKANTATTSVSFSKMFSPNSYPVVTASVIGTKNRNIDLTLGGIGQTFPNHQGFYAKVYVGDIGKVVGQIHGTIYIMWIAMGY